MLAKTQPAQRYIIAKHEIANGQMINESRAVARARERERERILRIAQARAAVLPRPSISSGAYNLVFNDCEESERESGGSRYLLPRRVYIALYTREIRIV